MLTIKEIFLMTPPRRVVARCFWQCRENSRFGEQVEDYACVYTSRVSNFRFYSPMQYFRGPRDRMPHER